MRHPPGKLRVLYHSMKVLSQVPSLGRGMKRETANWSHLMTYCLILQVNELGGLDSHKSFSNNNKYQNMRRLKDQRG
jgi:hypothetical protein